jgi:poly-gamma-glutamate capsule biosynthesis protein CapA/YwtB (metallophosphatase superfamily)
MKRFLPLIAALPLLLLLGVAACHLRPFPASGAAYAAPAAGQFMVLAVGDVMTDRNVDQRIRAHGMHSILEKVRSYTSAADISFANLECPLSTVGSHDPHNCVFRAPPDTVQVLLDGGFDVVSLANNHSLNAGREGLLQTLSTLEKHHLRYCGAARDRQGGRPTFLKVADGPWTIGFLAATDLSFAAGSHNKVAPDRSNLIREIRAARNQCDKLFVSIHWGDEYQSLPNARQRQTAHLALDAGADVILGHHPHTLQGVEVYKGKLILYSMGNFVFDQRQGERMESAIFRLKFTQGRGWTVTAKPIWIPSERMGPIFPEAARRDRILARLAKISKPLGTTLTVKDGLAWLSVPPAAAGRRH